MSRYKSAQCIMSRYEMANKPMNTNSSENLPSASDFECNEISGQINIIHQCVEQGCEGPGGAVVPIPNIYTTF